jgi:hypothetical protein
VEIWEGDRPLLGLHRFQPTLRPVTEPAMAELVPTSTHFFRTNHLPRR